MSTIHVYAIVAGLLFGTWPLMMQRTGLDGNVSSAVFAGTAFILVFSFALREGFASLTQANLPLAFAAGVVGGIGLLFFNGMLFKISLEEVASMFLLMIMVQISVPVIYHSYQTGDFSPRKLAGFGAAFVAAWLLR